MYFKRKIIMEAKIFIENLSKVRSNYSDPDQALSQPNTCDILSRDIDTDDKRLIYELLQNVLKKH